MRYNRYPKEKQEDSDVRGRVEMNGKGSYLLCGSPHRVLYTIK